MSVSVRHPRVEEFDALMRLLELGFGHSKGFFERTLGHVCRPDPEALAWSYVIEEGGQLVAHVGVYPIEVIADGVPLRIGGIGQVCTHPQARGKGYMSTLLRHSIDEMRARGYHLSWLGGDRQRYNTLGWERAAPGYTLVWSRRSLERQQVAPWPIEEQYPQDALAHVQRFQAQQPCVVVRPGLAVQLRRPGLRAWTSDDGYALAEGEEHSRLPIMELVSTSGHELELIRALIERTAADGAEWTLPAWDARLPRLMRAVEGYRSDGWWMYRIIDLYGLLQTARSYLERRAQAVRDFAVTIGIREHDRLDLATVAVENGVVEVRTGRHAAGVIELDPIEAVRLFLGGPPIGDPPTGDPVPPQLVALLPIPVYVPPLDHL